MSARLCALLADPAGADWAVDKIRSDPALHDEAKLVCGALARITSPCGDEAVIEALKPLVLVYGLGEQAKSPAFWQVYTKQLADVPAEALRLAVDDYASQPDSQFFPKPGPLREFALRRAEPVFRAASRSKRAAALPAHGAQREATDEEKALVARMAAETVAALTKPPAERPAMRPAHGKTDERGLTAAMREHLASRP